MATREEQGVTSKVQSIDRAVSIIETLSDYPSLSLNDLSDKVQLHKATTHRLVHSLIENGLIEQIEDTKQYRISLRMFELGNKRVQNIDFLNVAKSNIRQLSQEIGQTVHLVIEDRDEVLYVDKYGDYQESKMRSKIGLKAPLYCTAVGKAILATREQSEVDSYWGRITAEKKTEYTITELNHFHEELQHIREVGYALDDEEFEYGVFCVGCVFSSYKEEAAGAVSISLPISEKERKSYYIQKALECAEKITQLLGGKWK
ncbi:IclR family transcriptional regulator [Jeotgalibaca caeni]|uniref:IclR family transcriptional regulator n=1 Tax=Jeotgalibaca caeni TaxID=3028623 RepID=UPI00237D4B29|nr:IclR family transcriptional regulator [Jeotgalibaca caeni]MDE1547629.1 IclR family transcriptional regulator [Jeotgalibaca caeni]